MFLLVSFALLPFLLRFSTIKSITKTDDSRRSKYAITTLAMLTEIPKNYQKGKNTGLVLESLLGDVRGQVGRMNDKRGKAMARCCMRACLCHQKELQ